MALYIDDLIEDENDDDEIENGNYFVDLKALVDDMDDVENILPDESDEEADIGL